MAFDSNPQKILNNRRGFTLLELSIVLIIIGLIIGGIMMTRSLIRDAKIHNMMAEYDLYVKAIQEFQDKYQALPGDMRGATAIWGVTTCPNIDQTLKIATCDGDGDGHIGSSDENATLGNSGEWWLAWQHLSNAGLIDGRFSGGALALNSKSASVGVNVPASKLRPGGWTLLYYSFTNATPAATWADRYGHMLSFGSATANSFTSSAVLSPSEAAGIDQKIDDGKPGLGNVRAWISTTCTSGNVQATAAYTIDSNLTTQSACSLFFMLGF